MAANFPNSPSLNDTFTSSGVTFTWDGTAWKQPPSPGVKGQKGEKGEKGQKGEKGEKGEKGQKGEVGLSGNAGGKGEKGQKGEAGIDGSNGTDGTKGQKGELNEKGQKGEIGVTGTVFTSGTRMLFQQSSAPSGWTKDTSRNNRALRIVSGNVSDGGGDTFSSRFNSTVNTSGGDVLGHTLTTSQIPSHYHFAFRSGNHGQLRNGSNMSSNNYPGSGSGAGNLYESYNISASGSVSNVGRTSSVGSNSSHDHGFTNPSFNLNVLYTDVIIAQKN